MKKWMMLLLFCVLTAGRIAAQTVEDLDSKYGQKLLKPGTEIPDNALGGIQLKGRYAVLHFWASWCPDCRKEVPKVQELEQEAGDDVLFVHISYDTDKEAWSKYLQEHPMKGVHFSEWKKMRESNSSKAFGVEWIPAMYLIDPAGKVVLGTVDIHKLEKALKAIPGTR